MSTAQNLGIAAAVIGAIGAISAGVIQAFGPTWFREPAEAPAAQAAPSPAPAPEPQVDLQRDVAPNAADDAIVQPPPSGPMAVEPEAPRVVPAEPRVTTAPAPVTPPAQVVLPAKSEPAPAAPVSKTVVSRKPTFEVGDGVLSVKKEFTHNGSARSQLVVDVMLENNSSEQIRFLTMSAETSLMLDGRTKFKIDSVSTRYCTLSYASSCRKTEYDRYTEMAPGERRSVTFTFWGDVAAANRAVLPDAAKANVTLGLSVIYNEGPDEVVRLSQPAMKVDASAVN